MTMTREKMLEQQRIRPVKRYFKLNRKGLVDRATETVAKIALETNVDVHDVTHAHLAPLTKLEKADALRDAAEVVKSVREEMAAKEKVA